MAQTGEAQRRSNAGPGVLPEALADVPFRSVESQGKPR
jgi:hypothetical protein